MFYTQYCLGLAALSDESALTEEDATAYAIGSLDRLAAVRLPRCRKEVEDALAALSDPNYVTMSQQWQERCDRLQAERDEYHSQLDALRKEADGITELDREDILAARCRRAAAVLERTCSPTVVDGNAFMQVQKDYIEAFGTDNYGTLRQHIDAHTRRGDGSLEADLATLILYTTMKYHLANKAK